MTASRSNRWAQWALSAALFFAGLLITIIVCRGVFFPLDGDGGHVKYRKKEITTQAWVVASMISEPGESREAFIRRLAKYMQDWTDKNDAEACGFLATDGQRWGVKLTTQRSQVMCLMDPSIVPTGLVAKHSDDTIHSHPRASQGGWLEVSEATEKAAAVVGERGLERTGPWSTKVRVSVNGFSRDDYSSGPGFLVANGVIYYQKGRGTQQVGAQIGEAK